MPEMDWLLSTPIAHRGLHVAGRGIPENTLAAFEAARDAGFPIELDVRLLRDGAVAVFHDENLRRLIGVDGPVAEEDSRSIATRRVAGTLQTIPLLGQVLDLVGAKVPLVIELKNFGVPGDLEEAVLSTLEGYTGRFAVQSFNAHSMAWFKLHAPQITRGHLSGGFFGAALDGELAQSFRDLRMVEVSAPAYLGYDIRLLPHEPVASLREGGMPVVGWTVRTDDQLRKALAQCDNYIFEQIAPLSQDDET
jgi:glycerophosphoryl diester phosphodiesterase